MDSPSLQKYYTDFQNGTNPKAYIPLVAELRRQRQFNEALDVCQQGLQNDPSSAAGRINLVRIYLDLNRLSDADRELKKLEEKGHGNATGYLQERIRCSIKLRDYSGARAALDDLLLIAPFEPLTQQLQSELAELFRHSSPEVLKPGFQKGFSKTPQAILQLLEENLSPICEVIALDFFDLRAGKFLIRQNDDLLECAIILHEEVSQSSNELGAGNVRYSLLEMDGILFFVVSRGQYILFGAFDKSVNFGKIQHRVFLILDRHLPLQVNNPQKSQTVRTKIPFSGS
ncbi:MAG: tetratricopeptide repeat protein [Candidatus Sumerlaeia bacterium]|nr:tetratricopeptide repeat protein [Candidatus Sumerlaeia bacterium]